MEITPVHVINPKQAQLVIVGVGGTGGYLLQQVARLLYGLKVQRGKHDIPSVLLIDGDMVEEKNLLRQYFLPQDIGKKKASVLAERYSHAYGLDIAAYPEYISHETTLRDIGFNDTRKDLIVVGAVDNGSTRFVLDKMLNKLNQVVYIDSGNSGVEIPEDREHLDRYQLSKMWQSGWSGQVIAGVRAHGKTVLPFAGEVLPDLIEEDKLPTEISCGEVIVTNPQRHLTNLMAATSVLMFLTSLLTDGTLLHSRVFFDAYKGYITSHPAISMLHEVAVA